MHVNVNISQLNLSHTHSCRESCSQSVYVPASRPSPAKRNASLEMGKLEHILCIFNCKRELDAGHTLMVFKTSLCNVICHSIFITMPTGRSLLVPLTGKLKTKTKKKPYLFTSCFHRGGEQETLCVYYLASLHAQLAMYLSALVEE